MFRFLNQYLYVTNMNTGAVKKYNFLLVYSFFFLSVMFYVFFYFFINVSSDCCQPVKDAFGGEMAVSFSHILTKACHQYHYYRTCGHLQLDMDQ